jgi:arabinose-5-phosphate isomerase
MHLTLPILDAPVPSTDFDRLAYACQIVNGEAAALELVARRLDRSFLQAVDVFFHCQGRIAVTGVGKSADVGQKIAGTFNSTGTRAYLLDATRAMHGDLGMVHRDDVALVLSFSGESEEIVRLLGPLRDLLQTLVALTGNASSTLARQADIVVSLGALEEICPLGLAPSTTTTAMSAVGDAFAFVLSRMRGFSRADFARFHPAGSLGRKLLKVEAIMRRGPDLRVASCYDMVREVFARVRFRGRRTGAVILTDASGRMCGIFTDSDLARLIEQRRDAALDRPIREVMTANPITVSEGTPVVDAVDRLRQHKISELPVVDMADHPIGLIDITDVIAYLPAEEAEHMLRVA